MAADVSSLVRVMNGEDSTNESTAPITRDLLGGYCSVETKELELDSQVPCGWEKRLDLKQSGKVYLQRFNSTNSSSSSSDKNNNTESITSNLQDLNSPPTLPKHTLNLFENPKALDLKLVTPSPKNNNYCISNVCNNSPPNSSYHQSVCTLDKVRYALERAEKETRVIKKRPVSIMSEKSCSGRSNSSSSIELDCDIDHEERSCNGGGSFAAGCPSCLLFVLISTNNPKCPCCNSNVPFPVEFKKPRIDLNISM